jgi:hypothetical protein
MDCRVKPSNDAEEDEEQCGGKSIRLLMSTNARRRKALVSQGGS